MIPVRLAIVALAVCGLSATGVSAPVSRVGYQEAWRSSDDDPHYLIGVPAGAVRDRAGNVYVLDQQMTTVWVFDSRGEFVRRIARGGEGPGELARPRALAWQIPSSVLVVLELSPATLVAYSTTGDHLWSTTLESEDGRVLGWGLKARNEHMVLKSSVSVHDRWHVSAIYTVVALEDEGRRYGPTFISRAHQTDREHPALDEIADHFGNPWDVDGKGRLFVVREFDRYAVTVFEPNGVDARTIGKLYAHRMRSKAELRRLRAERTPPRCESCPETTVELAAFDKDIIDLRIADDGELWVLSSRGAYEPPNGVFQAWDVFDVESGEERGTIEVVLAEPADPRNDLVFWLADDELLVCRGWAGARRAMRGPYEVDLTEDVVGVPLEVICYRAPGGVSGDNTERSSP